MRRLDLQSGGWLVDADGIEMHVAVERLAGFGLTASLLGQLRAGAPFRVVNAVSDAMNDARPVTSRGKPPLGHLGLLRARRPAPSERRGRVRAVRGLRAGDGSLSERGGGLQPYRATT